MELNLTTAFTLRKRIKELASQYENVLTLSRYVIEPEAVNEQLEQFENNNVYDTFVIWSKCQDEVFKLQTLIDEHNNRGKEYLNALTAVNKKICVATKCAALLNANRTQKSRNPVTGNWEVITLKKITDTDFEKIKEALNKEKVRLEDELAKINSNEKFTFDLDEEIYKKIYG